MIMPLNLFEMMTEILNEDIRNKTEDITKALRGNNLCIFTVYDSQVPGYGSVPDVRYGVILAYGRGRYKNEPCIRVYQTNKRASYGQGQRPPVGSDYKIFYLKDILDMRITPQKVLEAPPEFNPNEDKWMSETYEVAKFKNFIPKQRYRDDGADKNQPSDVYKTDTEKEIEKSKEQWQQPMQIDVTGQSKTNQERFRQMKALTNKALAIYNKVRRTGDQNAIAKAKADFAEINAIANRYMAIYKKELKNKQ